MNAALLFSASAQPADGLSIESVPGAVLPESDQPAKKFSMVMDGALSQLSRQTTDADQGKPAAGLDNVVGPFAEAPSVIRQIIAYLGASSGELVSTLEPETTDLEEKPKLDQDEAVALATDPAAIMMASLLPPPLLQLPLEASPAPTSSASAGAIAIGSESGAGTTAGLPLVDSQESATPGLPGELIPTANRLTDSDKRARTALDLRPLTRSQRDENPAVPAPALDVSRSLVESFAPADSSPLIRRQVEPVQDRLPAANLSPTVRSDNVDSVQPVPSENQIRLGGQTESAVAFRSPPVLATSIGGSIVDPALITRVENSFRPVESAAAPQLPDVANGVAMDETAAASLVDPATTDRAVLDKPLSVLNRRSVDLSTQDGSRPAAVAGIGGAKLDNRTMKSDEQDQNAGLRLQRLPSGNLDSIAAEGGAGDLSIIRSGVRSLLDGDFNFRPPAADLGSQAAVSRFDSFDTGAVARAGATPAERVERVEHMILKEASVVKQSGAESLAVVLKPDAQTELFLQINQRAGQIEAVVRFDRGDAAGLGLYWPQLRESLARMDVQLQPMKEFTQSNGGHNSQGSFSSADQQNSSGQRTPRFMSWEGEPASGQAVSGRETMRQTVARTRRQSGWESWA